MVTVQYVPQVVLPEVCFLPEMCPSLCPRCASADYRITDFTFVSVPGAAELGYITISNILFNCFSV